MDNLNFRIFGSFLHPLKIKLLLKRHFKLIKASWGLLSDIRDAVEQNQELKSVLGSQN